MPHRYFTTEISEGTATLRGADAHHLARVMRAKPGDTVILCDGNAVEYTATITGFGEDRVDFAVEPGYPSAAEPSVEVTLFAVVALLVSPLGIVDVAGHQIALNFSSLMFVLPMSLAAAVTIRVGYRLGQGSTLDAQTAARTGLMVGVCMATLTAIFTVSLREQIALLYNDNPEVVTLAAHLMLLAAVYQISDSIQVIGSGILRGYKDTRSIFYITFTAYWVLGLPSGYILALTDLVVEPMGPAGFWIGFIIGLTSAAIMMMLRMRFLQRLPSAIILQRASR